VTASYGAIGYIDDAAKIRRKDTGGLSGRYKLLLQFAIAGGLCYWLYYGEAGLPADWLNVRLRLHVPFLAFDKHPISMPGWLYVIFGAFVIAGFSNGVNLTDGLDGLAIGPVMINAGTYAIFAYLSGVSFFGETVADYLHIPAIASASELAVFCAAVIGAGIGFLWFNTYPAQVFMGDVGSLALGGGLGALAVLTKNELVSLILGGIFVVEAVSVIAQVAVFKTTGKRVFLMAPIHHHFEKKGWPEPRVIVRFWIISIMLALVALAQVKLR
jgi:phospho-N-acetylmuramoyl-pentapeptide-transferase